MLQRIELGKQAGPSRHDLELLRQWLISSKGNNGDLQGPGFDIWHEEDGEEDCRKRMDFAVLSAKHDGRDSFLSWVGDKGFGMFHRLFGRLIRVNFLAFAGSESLADRTKQKNTALIDEECGLVEFKDRGILTVVNVISTLLASLLVTMPMIVLLRP